MTEGSVHSAFTSRMPSVNRARYLSAGIPYAANGRRGPPDPTPTSTRPPLTWSSVARSLASWTGLCRVVTNTVQPSRSEDVHAAAYVIASRGASCGDGPSVISCAHALSYTPNASARSKYARKSAGENSPSPKNWGIEIANLMPA